ncbi:hypothetical protein [Flagellimonas onchidii]|uniref:hypothetical protein n=1 Tax=Flagellimonas onchidii TaxID=2562684 RepID=UPI0010A6A879|nr:hypothetical protein [Allomuricauda onchidii]
MQENIKLDFKLIEKKELRDLFLEFAADAQYKGKRAKTHHSKRNHKRTVQIFGSAATYITELMENKNSN